MSHNTLKRHSRALVAASAFAVSALQAHASTFTGSDTCVPGDTTLNCKLARYLPFLYVTAAVLAVVLVIAIAFAIHTYRKNLKTEFKGDQ